MSKPKGKTNLMARQEKQLLVLANSILLEEITHSDIKDIGITHATITNDYDHAVLYFDTTNLNDKLTEALKTVVPFFKKRIAESLDFRRVPEIEFKFDESLFEAKNIENILKKIKNK